MPEAWIKRILLILIFLSLVGPSRASSVLPTGQAEYEFVYDRLERGETLTFGDYSYQLGPYENLGDEFSFGPFEFLRRLPSTRLAIFSFAGEDFYAEKNRSADGFEAIRGGIAASPVENLFVYGNFLLDERKAEDPLYTGKKWRGLAGGVEQAFVHYRLKKFEFMVGRFASFWGPRHSMVLSPKNALDGFGYSFHWGRLVLSYRLARLDGLDPDVDDVAQYEYRYFAGHRLDVRLARNLRVGVFETIIYGGPGRQVELLYLNPIVFFHADQLNEGFEDNTLMGFDVTYKPISGVKLYGQLVVDDFQVEKESQGDQEPDQYGLIVGGHFVDLIEKTDFRLEYSRVTNWTFNQGNARNRYLFEGEVIGVADGNDFDLTEFCATRWFSDDVAISANVSLRRQGEGRVTDDWTRPWLDVEGDYGEPFPTGVVEKTTKVSIELKSFVLDHFFVQAEGGVNLVKNYSNIDGDDRDLPFARIQVSTFFSIPISVE